jgi:hypothetical protein
MINMLPLAATAVAKIRAGWGYPRWGGADDLIQPAETVILFFVDDLDPCFFSLESIRYKDDLAVDPGYSVTFEGHGFNGGVNVSFHDSNISWMGEGFN